MFLHVRRGVGSCTCIRGFYRGSYLVALERAGPLRLPPLEAEGAGRPPAGQGPRRERDRDAGKCQLPAVSAPQRDICRARPGVWVPAGGAGRGGGGGRYRCSGPRGTSPEPLETFPGRWGPSRTSTSPTFSLHGTSRTPESEVLWARPAGGGRKVPTAPWGCGVGL